MEVYQVFRFIGQQLMLVGVLTFCGFVVSQNARAGGAPDLVVDSVLVVPTAWFLDETIFVDSEISNAGDGVSDATVVDFYLSKDQTIDTGDIDFGNGDIAALDPGATGLASIELVLNSTPGPYWVGVCVRPVSGESNTANNCSEGIEVLIQENTNACSNLPLSCNVPLAAELTEDDCDDSPRGRSHYAKMHTFQGVADSDISIVANWGGDGYLFLTNPSGAVVASNNNDTGIFDSRIDHTIDVNGIWTVWATTLETFDLFGYNIQLVCEVVPGVDLAVTEIDAQPQTLDPGDELTITATVENLGSVTSQTTTLSYRLSTDATISEDDALLGEDPIGPLDSEEETEDNLLTMAPSNPGLYWVGACVEEVETEFSSDNNCSAGVQIRVRSDEAIAITAGLNDAWFNPETNGQGFFFNVFPGLDQVFVGWFTFEQGPVAGSTTQAIGGPDQRWLTAFGSFTPTLGALDLYTTSGGVFNSDEPVATEVEDGTFDFLFTSCKEGVVQFTNTSSGLSGEIPISRISNDNVPLCEELSGTEPSDVLTSLEINPAQVAPGEMFAVSWTTNGATNCTPAFGTGGWEDLNTSAAGGTAMLSTQDTGLHVFDLECSAVGEQVTKRARVLVTDPQSDAVFQISEGLNDAWFNPETSGQGFFINVFPGSKQMFLAWFTYDTERPENALEAIGEPGHRWFTAFGPYDQNSADLDLEVTTGGVFNQAPPNPGTVIDGSIEVEFIDCQSAIVNFDIASAELSGEIMINRISSDNVELCEELSGGTESQ